MTGPATMAATSAPPSAGTAAPRPTGSTSPPASTAAPGPPRRSTRACCTPCRAPRTSPPPPPPPATPTPSPSPPRVLPVAGAQAAIQLLPRLAPPGCVAILSPTYNEHAAAFRAAGWQVEDTSDIAALAGADAAVVVNPNNPDGRRHTPGDLTALAARVGLLIVDESFADPTPDLSLCPTLGRPGLIVLRSLGKFTGLAGLRLGFALGAPSDIARLAELAGPWAVSGPALALGAAALADTAWTQATRARLAADARRLDALAPWPLAGGTALFRTYDTPDAAAAQDHLARARIWSRIFPWSTRWLRLGLPGEPTEWDRLAAALG